MTKTDELREKIAGLILEAAQTKAELLSDRTTSDYQNGWQSGLVYALEETQKLLAILPAQPDVSGLVEALERIVSIKPVEEDPGDEYGFSNCQTMGHNEGVAECQDIARQALTLSATPESGWLPIESAPKESLILVRTARGTYHTGLFDNYNGGTWWIAGTTVEIRPTHWMPLPDAPNTEGSE